ncbi:uncharacterized protein OCT59_017995 [Rhizophagus irregularis]|uniref:Uncharacterized protein n=1 Tax=Rhizophagus irregularis (strain DAOM 197198w) TaxID=1432141 RepID=A0A015K749_RHIIW|nr:hypothetical protein RirG_042390 [Rhizophagus irregularis DAOM 197198w]UZO25734.1 hypothetical protein OCT59_017995 [Rhizophagus irregularis]
MPYGPKGKLVTPPFIRPIFIVTVWDAVVLFWKYIISQPLRKEFMKQEKNQELLFQSITSWQVWRNEGIEKIGIRKCQKSIEAESGDDEINIFKCQNREKIDESLLGPVLRVGALKGSSWKENYLKTPCYFVYPDSKPKWMTNTSMFPVSNDNRFDSSGNNLSLFLEMLENILNRYHIANFLDIKLLNLKSNDYLQKDNIRLYAMNIALCGFNHIIIIGETYCGLLFLDCYGHIFQWDAMADALVFYGNIFEGVLGKSHGVLWGVSGDGSVWKLSDLNLPEECNSHPVSNKKKSKKKGKNKNQKSVTNK